MSELHNHYCPECKLCGKPDWSHDRETGCKIEDGKKYPCSKHILFYGIRVSNTDKGAEQIYLEEQKMKAEFEKEVYDYYILLRGKETYF